MALPADTRLQPDDLTVAQANALTANIRQTGDRLAAMITEAWRGRVWVALGYESWAEWRDTELPGMALPQDERRQVVAELSAEGMSTRAIATAVGASKNTITSDLAQVSQIGTPDSRPSTVPGDAHSPRCVCSTCSTEIAEGAKPEFVTPSNVIGLDGKRYTRPEPRVLTKAEQRDAHLAESDARAARYLEKAISNWPTLYGLRTDDRRDLILAHLCESDLALLADIEGKLL